MPSTGSSAAGRNVTTDSPPIPSPPSSPCSCNTLLNPRRDLPTESSELVINTYVAVSSGPCSSTEFSGNHGANCKAFLWCRLAVGRQPGEGSCCRSCLRPMSSLEWSLFKQRRGILSHLTPRDDSDLKESNKPKGKKSNPSNGSPERGNGSATKRTGLRSDTGKEKAKSKKTPTKLGETSSEEEKQEAESEEEKQEPESEEKQIKEAKLAWKEKKADLKQLLDKKKESTKNFVIYVVGESGVGKRYLIRKAYDDAIKDKKFDVVHWAIFPADTSDIPDQINKELKEKCSKLQPSKELKEAKYLVVLDCPMSSALLGSITEKFPQGAAGSKIVVTATSSPPEKIDYGVIKLGYLYKDKCKTLFNDTIGLGGHRKSVYKTTMMNTVRDHIEEITNGLPLAVILLAKLMRTMDYNKWEDASKYIMNNNQDHLLKTIVSMGIDDLPDELKSCLLYMAGFPERRKIDSVQLVRLWMAEGFLTQQIGVEPEELGQRYLKELIFRGLVELEKKKEDMVESVYIRDQIHRFFRWEAQRTGFMETHYGGSAPVPDSARRLALNSTNLPKPDKMKVLKKLRTVLSHTHDGHNSNDAKFQGSFQKVFPELLRHSIFLRVISLEGVNIGEDLPRHIGKLLHLQYLGVQCPTLRTVPDTIGKLKRLQIMDVRGTNVESLPDSFWNIKSLLRVLTDNDKLRSIVSLKLPNI